MRKSNVNFVFGTDLSAEKCFIGWKNIEVLAEKKSRWAVLTNRVERGYKLSCENFEQSYTLATWLTSVYKFIHVVVVDSRDRFLAFLYATSLALEPRRLSRETAWKVRTVWQIVCSQLNIEYIFLSCFEHIVNIF